MLDCHVSGLYSLDQTISPRRKDYKRAEALFFISLPSCRSTVILMHILKVEHIPLAFEVVWKLMMGSLMKTILKTMGQCQKKLKKNKIIRVLNEVCLRALKILNLIFNNFCLKFIQFSKPTEYYFKIIFYFKF